MIVTISLNADLLVCRQFLHHAASMERVCNYGIMCRCYRFQQIFDDENRLLVHYTIHNILKDMVYLLALSAGMLIIGTDFQ